MTHFSSSIVEECPPFFPKNLTPLITKSSAFEEMCKKPMKTQHITPCLQIATKNILAANAP